MNLSPSLLKLPIAAAVFIVVQLSNGLMAQVTVEQALGLKPVQQGNVEYSIPTDEEIEGCSIQTPADKKITGWIVKDPADRLLRRFLDTNGDNDLDLWCYYKDGVEVYRDIDSNFDRKADQYRWFGTEGTRWGLDEDQDGKIDQWKRISAEEVSSEVTAALATGDADRFFRLLIQPDELSNVGFSKKRIEQIEANLKSSRKKFKELIAKNANSYKDVQWIHFGGLRPGLIPEGTDDATRDIEIYENVAALIRKGNKDIQVSLGTLVLAGQCWRMVDSPAAIDESSQLSFASWYRSGSTTGTNASMTTDLDSDYQKLLSQFEELDKKLAAATTSRGKADIYNTMATTISRLAIEADSAEDSLNWARQFADTMTAAFQSGDYEEGLNQLQKFAKELKRENKSDSAIALVQYRYINADFGAKLNDKSVDVGKAQSVWLDALKEFTEDYPRDENTPDAMMQLAMADEFDGEKDKAKSWYEKVTSDFAGSEFGPKAKGAIRRLNSIGKSMPLSGTTIGGRNFDLSKLRGKVVLIHYWADWCDICKQEFENLEEIQDEYSGKLLLVGVNCDNELTEAKKAVQSTGVKWTQLHSKGGYNSGFAAEMGIVTLPSMILIGPDGKIVSTTVSLSTLERELKSILK